MKLRHATVLAVIGVLPLAACGSDDNSESTAASAAASPDATNSSEAADFNAGDVEFLQAMIPHHEQAIAMADIALEPSRGARAEVVDLATRIRAAQDPEIEQMTALLLGWDQPAAAGSDDGHGMSMADGMMTPAQMDALRAMTGDEFDTMWMEMMITHHEGAVAMSTTVKANGLNADVLALADQIIAAQQAEIAEMQSLLGG